MSQPIGQESLQNYVKRIGEHINKIYQRLGEVEVKLNTLLEEVNTLKVSADANKAEVKSLQGSMVLKSEFDEFVSKLTESFNEILPPVEVQKEETSQQQ
jgi:regulator of replication initiation timing